MATKRARPLDTEWTYASIDGLVLLSGRLVSSTLDEGSQFQLDRDGIFIVHPSLITITTASNGATTLHSLNSGTPILTLPAPSRPSSDTPDLSPSLLATLHPPFLTPSQLAALRLSPFFSSTFDVLLQAPGFPPPTFDPTLVPPTPSFGPTHSSSGTPNGGASPSMQRILLSPLLSPMRRAASQGSDMSVPPLSLGLARGRAASLTGRNGPSNNASMGMLPSSNGTDGMESLSAIATSEINANAAETAEKLLVLRRAHDAFVRRVRVEQDVLETRAEGSGSGKVVRGFGEGVSPNRSVSRGSRSASGSRERSRGRDTSLERSKLGLMDWPEEDDRGRAGNAAGREQEGTERDEAASQKMREEDKAEEDARGRSRSRNRRRDDGSPLPPPEVELKPIPAPVPVVPTPIVSSASVATPTFIPQSHALVSIPESEEMSLPPSQAITPTSLSRPDSPPLLSTSTIIVNGADDDEDFEIPFELDEDISLAPLAPTSPFIAPAASPEIPKIDLPSSPPVQSREYRSSSYRPSSLLASYDALLSSSVARASHLQQQQRLSSQSYTPLSPFSFSTPPDLPRTVMATSAREDALVELTNVAGSLSLNTSAEERDKKVREMMALDAPSHRALLPSRRGGLSAAMDLQPDPFDEVDDDEGEAVPSAFVVGSLPMGRPHNRFGAGTQFFDTSAMGGSKSSVSSREKVTASPIPANSSPALLPIPTASPQARSISNPMSILLSRSPSATATTSNISASYNAGPSSLAQMLRHPPASFARMEEAREAEEAKGEGEDEFVPPHVWRAKGRLEEDLLSRSVSI